jgi:RNA polymerase sigma-70 factor (ECF subfamily)
MGEQGRALEERWRAWMASAQQGDAQAYERLLRELLPALRAFARSRLTGPSAEDVVQNALLSIHRARHTYRPERPFGPWWRAIARHAVIDFVRAQSRRGAELALDELDLPAPEPDREERRLSPHLEAALAALPPGQRQAVELLHVEGLSVAEAALRVGITPGALKVRAHRGYRALRARLERGSS